MTRAVHVLSDERFAQAESPRWDARTGGLAWIDMATGTLHHGRLEVGILRPAHAVHVGDRIGAPAPLAETGAGWLVGVGADVVHVSDEDTITPVATGLAPEPAFMNDGGCDRSGRFWIGTQSVPRAPRCALYSVEPDGHTVERLGGVTVSNGLAFDPAGTTLFYIDTLPDRSIEAFDVADDGVLSNRRTVCRVVGGNPDGLAIDSEGMLWVAVWDAAEVRALRARWTVARGRGVAGESANRRRICRRPTRGHDRERRHRRADGARWGDPRNRGRRRRAPGVPVARTSAHGRS